MQKIERMLAILLILNKKGKLTAEELARKFEVNVRTIYRDIQALSEMEVPIVTHIGSNGGYSLIDKYFIPPIMFTRDEVMALMLSEKIIGVTDIPGYTRNINTAFLKIRNLVDQELQDELSEIERRLIFDVGYEYPDNQDVRVFKTMEEAILKNRVVDIKYINLRLSQLEQYTIYPYGLVYNHGEWNIVAYCENIEEEQIYKMTEIKHAELLEREFALPQDFNVEGYYNCHNYSDLFKKGDRSIVKLKMTKGLYNLIKDKVYFKDAVVLEEEASYLLEIATKKPEDYIWLSMQYAGEILIVEPAWLIDKLINKINTLNNQYK